MKSDSDGDELDSDDSIVLSSSDDETAREGNLESMKEKARSNYLFESQLQEHRSVGQHDAYPGSLRMVYSLPNQQRMPLPVVIDTSSKCSLGTIASVPGS